jgi:hypothetical protein
MPYQGKKYHPALKHSGFCVTGLLPGEDRAKFEKLYEGLISEFHPDGPLEHDAVRTIARLLWRKQNLQTFRDAEFARKHLAAIRFAKIPRTEPPFADFGLLLNQEPNWKPPSDFEIAEGKKAAEVQAKKDLGTDGYLLAVMEERATISQLFEDLNVQERLDTLIGQQVKRLMVLKGLKSISLSSVSTSAPLPRIEGPKKAA